MMSRLFRRVRIKPWMRDWEIGLVEEVLRRIRPRRCLEWGAGQSTLYFPKQLTRDATWLSVEHDHDWFLHVRQQLASPGCYSRQRACEREKVHLRGSWPRLQPLSRAIDRAFGGARIELVHVAPNRLPWSDPDGDGAYADLADYVEYPGVHGPFDFILVDGRARRECLHRAHSLLTDDGIVVLHDAGRGYYHGAFAAYESQTLFRDAANAEAGVWLGSRRARPDWTAPLVEARRLDTAIRA